MIILYIMISDMEKIECEGYRNGGGAVWCGGQGEASLLRWHLSRDL